jgi:hypothetical protein
MRHVAPVDIVGLPTLADIEASLKPAYRAAIADAIPPIETAYESFDSVKPDGLHTLAPIGLSLNARRALEAVFSRRLGTFGAVMDAINDHFEDTGNSTCPYCNFGEQWEQDHYLPKSIFPEFTLYAANLVPICKVCNGKKKARYHAEGERLFLYAFSELNGATDMLKVDVGYEPTISVTYSLADPGDLENFAVLDRHFQALNLGRRYSRQASSTLARLVRIFRTPVSLGLGRRQLQRRIKQMAEDRAVQSPPNHWEVALFDHLASSADFVAYIFN